jgi:hypothetical protein
LLGPRWLQTRFQNACKQGKEPKFPRRQKTQDLAKYPFSSVKHLCPPSQTKLNATLKFGVGLQDMVKECHYAHIILLNTMIISKVDRKTLWALQTIWIVIDLVG